MSMIKRIACLTAYVLLTKINKVISQYFLQKRSKHHHFGQHTAIKTAKKNKKVSFFPFTAKTEKNRKNRKIFRKKPKPKPKK